jgi:folylpolyglutamate synthase/dihydropteroate synthase
VIIPICESFNNKLIVIKDDDMFVNINNNISLALYKEILKDVEEVPIHLDEEGIKEALKIAQPCRLELVPLETIKEFAPDLDVYPIATYMDIASNPLGIRKVIKAIRNIHEKDQKLKIYLLISFKKPKD